MELINGKTYINGLQKSPCIISKAKYALGLKKARPTNQKVCSQEYYIEVVTALGKYYKVPKEKIEKAKKSRIYLQQIISQS